MANEEMKHEPGVKSEVPSGMHPKEPDQKILDGTHQSHMSQAVRHLHKETERHEHAAEVCGHKIDHRHH